MVSEYGEKREFRWRGEQPQEWSASWPAEDQQGGAGEGGAARNSCAVCFGALDSGEALVHGTCGHAFHTKCLRELADHVRLSSHTRRSLAVSCPLCRTVTRAEVGGADI